MSMLYLETVAFLKIWAIQQMFIYNIISIGEFLVLLYDEI